MKSVRITEAVDEYVETLRLQGRAPNTIRSRPATVVDMATHRPVESARG